MGLNLNDMYPSKYLNANDCPHPRTLKIEVVQMELVGQTKDNKPVVYFAGENKGLILNKTCATQIAEIAQSDDTDDWSNVWVELYVDQNVYYQGKRTPGIRIRAPRQQQQGSPQGGQQRQSQPANNQQQMAPPDAVYDQESIPDPGDPMPAAQQQRRPQPQRQAGNF